MYVANVGITNRSIEFLLFASRKKRLDTEGIPKYERNDIVDFYSMIKYFLY